MLNIMEKNAQNGHFSLDTPSSSSKRGHNGDNFG